MSTEELLKPRYRVIADWPGCEIQVNDILMAGVILSKAGWYSQNGKRIHGPEFFPHLFKPLQWWEDRDKKELPQYVKTDNIVFKVDKYEEDNGHDYLVIFECGSVYVGACIDAIVYPATEQEYLESINKTP